MQSISSELQEALYNNAPQRVLLVFSDREFTNEDILLSNGLEISEEFNSEEDLTIGLTPSAMARFSLLNDENQLEDFEFGWFRAYIGAKVEYTTGQEITREYEDGTYAFCPMGQFYASKPKIIRKKTVAVSAYDRMAYLEGDMPSSETLGITYPTTIGTIFTQICTTLNVPTTVSSFLNSGLEVAEEPADFRNVSVRQVIGWIAECACSNARFSREGNLEFAWFGSTEAEFDESQYKAFTPAWYETKAIDGLYCRNMSDESEASEGSTKTNNYLIQDNPFLRE